MRSLRRIAEYIEHNPVNHAIVRLSNQFGEFDADTATTFERDDIEVLPIFIYSLNTQNMTLEVRLAFTWRQVLSRGVFQLPFSCQSWEGSITANFSL